MIALLVPLAANAEGFLRDCGGVTTQEISTCNELRYKNVDAQLNTAYKERFSALPTAHRKQLIETQRTWISFKEKHCEAVYQSVLPGREAQIDKYICLWKMTDDRRREIERLDSIAINDEFHNFLLSLQALGFPRSEIVSKLQGRYASEKDGWHIYAERNCRLAEAISSENFDICTARLNAQRGSN